MYFEPEQLISRVGPTGQKTHSIRGYTAEERWSLEGPTQDELLQPDSQLWLHKKCWAVVRIWGLSYVGRYSVGSEWDHIRSGMSTLFSFPRAQWFWHSVFPSLKLYVHLETKCFNFMRQLEIAHICFTTQSMVRISQWLYFVTSV